MKTDKKLFLRGILFGVILAICLNTIGSSLNILYRRYVSKELTYEQKMKEISYYVDKLFVNDFEKEKFEEGSFYGMLESLNDKYTYYMSKDEFSEFMENTTGTYVGIGVVVSLSEDGKMTVIQVFDGSPAEEAGLKVYDKITKINDTEINEENYQEAIPMIKGVENTNVNLTIFRDTTDETFETTATRRSVNVPTVTSKIIDDKYGYIKISAFDVVTTEQFFNEFNSIKENIDGLVIDLRNNPGGILDVVTAITNQFVPEGFITYIEYKDGEKNYEYSDNQMFGKPLVILVNGNSASASEVMAGAVKDLKTGILVGTKTYGKGVVQNIFPLSDGSGVKLTTAKYYTPSGVCIDGEGIEPDYVVEIPEIIVDDEDVDIQLNKALEILREKTK